jgi:hypothetical protein
MSRGHLLTNSRKTSRKYFVSGIFSHSLRDFSSYEENLFLSFFPLLYWRTTSTPPQNILGGLQHQALHHHITISSNPLQPDKWDSISTLPRTEYYSRPNFVQYIASLCSTLTITSLMSVTHEQPRPRTGGLGLARLSFPNYLLRQPTSPAEGYKVYGFLNRRYMVFGLVI